MGRSDSQSVSQWNAWPATGRSALQDLRSWAIFQQGRSDGGYIGIYTFQNQ